MNFPSGVTGGGRNEALAQLTTGPTGQDKQPSTAMDPDDPKTRKGRDVKLGFITDAAFSGRLTEGGFLWAFLLVRKWKAAEGDGMSSWMTEMQNN